MGRRRNRSGQSLAWVLLVTLAGCSGNVPVARGFGSRQVVASRDPTLQLDTVLDVQGQDATLVYTTLASPDAPSVTYWSLDLVTGALQNDGAHPPSLGSPPSPPTARYTCVTNDLMPDGTATLEVTDTTTGVETEIDGVTTFPTCVNDDGSFSVFRADPGTGNQALWTGPYQNLARVALPFDILKIGFYLGSATGQGLDVVVLGASSTEPSAVGLYSIDMTSGAAAVLVPATPASVAWAAGAPQAGSLQSAGLSPDVQISYFYGHYLYARTMSDGGTTLFAGPFTSGPASELALFQLSASGTAVLAPGVPVGSADDVVGRRAIPHVVGWQVDGGNGVPSELLVWDQDGQQVTLCPSSLGAFEAGVASVDGTRALFRALQLGGQLTVAPLQLLSLAAGQPHSCVALQDGNVTWADFSGDGTAIAWLVATGDGFEGELWTANADGSNPQMILSGQMLAAQFVRGTSHLELSYSGDLVWLDVHDPTGFVHVAEQLFGQPTGIGGSWFVAGYDYSSQDASGMLGVVNLDTSKKWPISPGVTQYVVVPQTAPPDGGVGTGDATGVYDVAYQVRGRNPSAQDGIWVATVQAADLQ